MMADERKFSFKFRNSAERNAALAFLKAHEPSFDVHTPSVTDVIVTDDACESLKTFLRSIPLQARQVHEMFWT